MYKIEEKIIAHSKEDISLDVELGKSGICIYLFMRSRLLNDPKVGKLAEKLLEEVCGSLSAYKGKGPSPELIQIGIGIDYLLRNTFVKGNSNTVLGDFDDIIFHLFAPESTAKSNPVNLMRILYYICIRLEKQKKGSDSHFMLEELCIKVFNELCESLDSTFFEEPILFNLDYRLPQFLYVVGKIHALKFYNYRIDEVLKEISGLILSKFPVSHANRLYLLWGLVRFKELAESNIFDEQIELLHSHIDYKKIIYEELQNKTVFIKNGVAGIYLLLAGLEKTSCPIPYDKQLLKKRIEDSDVWKEDQWTKENLGLIHGFSSLIMTYLLITN
jgi:hypothetical protein